MKMISSFIMVTWTFEAIKMKAELTAIIEAATEGDYWAICPEIAGANGQ
jgi:hypothetical protein